MEIRAALGVILLSLLAPSTAFADRSVVLLTSEYPPYHSETLPNQGILAQIVKEAFASSGYRVTFQFKPFARTLQEGKTDKVDGVLSLWYSDERAKDFLYSAPLPASRIGFFARRGIQINYLKLSDLSSYRIGVVRGYDNPKQVKEAGLEVEITANDAQNIAMLVAGRLDLALIDERTGGFLLYKNHPDRASEYSWQEPALEERLQYVGFSKRAKDYLGTHRAFNRGLSKLQSNGRIEEILEAQGYVLQR
ncbi:MAG: transporter substrate-binding domain-containing protein [Motiliproteus sp.]